MSNKVEATFHVSLEETKAAREVQNTFALVLDEIRSAVRKHGYARTPLSTDMGDASKLIVLVEEVGEIARAITYDNADYENLKAELVQVATMALAWRAALA